jgi:hypothetical protein
VICEDVAMRNRLAWLVAAPLAVVGIIAGHAVGYRAAVPDAQERAQVLASSGHTYLEYAPLAIALCLALVVLGFAATTFRAFGGHAARSDRPRIGLIAALAPLAFVFQEAIERYAHDGHVHWAFVVSAPFLWGLVAQLPFALLAAAVASVLTATAQRLGRAVAAGRRRRPVSGLGLLAWVAIDLPREPVLARGYTGRGPPFSP